MAKGVEGRAFVGRSGELARLRAAFDEARRGPARGILVGGEAGVGKTRLIEAFLPAIRHDATVLVGACLEFASSGPPYGPFVEALRSLVRMTEPARLPALLGPWRPELARLLPELAPRAPESAPPEFDRSAQARLFEIILGVLERLARANPLVLVIEDIHWADQSTRDLLTFLVRNLRDDPVLFIVSVRSDELHGRHPGLPAIAELEREPHVERVEVRRFVRPELAALMRGVLGREPEPALVDAVLARTDGNAFFAEQLVEAAGEAAFPTSGEGLPPRLRDVLLARIGALSDRAQEVLRAASAAGRAVDDALLAAVLDAPEREVAAALREVTGRGILVPRSADGDAVTGYAFHHALLREVVYAELFTGERRALHAAFATALAERGEVAGQHVGPGDLAYHWDAARDWPKALPALLDAGRSAEAAYAYVEALRWYERALQVWDWVTEADALVPVDRVGVLQRAAEVCVLLGEPARAVDLGRAAIAAHAETAERAPGREGLLVGHLHDRLRWFLWEAGDRAAASAEVRRAVSMLPATPPSQTRARALGQLAAIDLHAGRFRQAAEGARVAVEAARAAGGRGEEALARGVLGWAIAALGDVDEGIRTYRTGLDIALELRGVEGIALGYAEFARMLDALGLAEAALDAAREGHALARRMGLERTYGGTMQGHMANALFELGRWDEAWATVEQGLALGPSGRAALWLLVNAARVATGRGETEDAASFLAQARDLQLRHLGAEFGPKLLAARGELAVACGELDEARAAWTDAWATLADDAVPDPSIQWLGAVVARAEADAAVRARVRRDASAERIAAEGAAAIETALARIATILGPADPDFQRRRVALDALVAAEAARARDGGSPEAWAGAVHAWDRAGSPYPASYARLRLAETAMARDDRATAAEALGAAHAAATAMGAVALRTDIETLARHARLDLAGGAGGGARSDGSAFGFTEREAEVLRLVAGGWSNQQIADALFISRKTASVHVSNILAKLGVSSRGEAAAVAHRIGLGRDAPRPPGSEPAA